MTTNTVWIKIRLLPPITIAIETDNFISSRLFKFTSFKGSSRVFPKASYLVNMTYLSHIYVIIQQYFHVVCLPHHTELSCG